MCNRLEGSGKMQWLKWIIAMLIVILTTMGVLMASQTKQVNKDLEVDGQELSLPIQRLNDMEQIKQNTIYTVELSVNQAYDSFEGMAHVSYTHHSKRVTDTILMSAHAIEIKSVKINAASVAYKQDGGNLEIQSPFVIQEDEEVAIIIEFQGRLGKGEESNTKGYYMCNFIPTVFLYDEGIGWVTSSESDIDGFRLTEPANYSVTVHTYEGQYPIGTGTLDHMSKNDRIITASFSADRVRGFGMFLGPEMEREIFYTEEGYSIALYHSAGDDIAKDIIPEVKESLNSYSDIFGTYPYDQFTVIHKEGLEIQSYPTLIMGDFSGQGDWYSKINKPVAEQWLYYIIGNRNENECWLSIGLLEYLNKRFLLSEGEMALYIEGQEDLAPLHENIAINLFYEIEKKVGEEKFIEALRAYYKDFSFRMATGDDFIEIIEEVSGKSVVDIYSFWLHKRTKEE